jgi:hypothetical protein
MSHLDTIGPIATIPDCAREIGITNQSLYTRMKVHQMTPPDTFRAGGMAVMTTDNARIWVAKHNAEWAAIQAAKKGAA